MNSKELQEKLNKALETVDKRKSTIERHKVQAEKKLQLLSKNGWEADRNLYIGGKNHDAYWAVCEYEGKLEDIKSATQKLKDAEIIANNWKEKLDVQLKKDLIIATEMPEIFLQCKDDLAKEWQISDIRQRETMKKYKSELSYEEFRKKYKYTEEQDLCHTDEEFYKIELRLAELFIIDLYNRVKAITGEVIDWGNIYYAGKALNGWVEGMNGKAKVETIGAGGYNIQRFHLRVLVKQIS